MPSYCIYTRRPIISGRSTELTLVGTYISAVVHLEKDDWVDLTFWEFADGVQILCFSTLNTRLDVVGKSVLQIVIFCMILWFLKYFMAYHVKYNNILCSIHIIISYQYIILYYYTKRFNDFFYVKHNIESNERWSNL